MIVLQPDLADPMAAPARAGVEAEIGWNADLDGDAVIYVAADRENLRRLARWLGTRPKALVPELA